MEVYDNPESPHIVATLEVPGVQIHELVVFVRDALLTIRGFRRRRYPTNPSHPSLVRDPLPATGRRSLTDDRLFTCRELRYGCFQRVIPLPPGIDVGCEFFG